MANVVRFTLPAARSLNLPGIGYFVAGVLDINAENYALVSKARYRVRPFGAVEVGVVAAGTAPPALPAVPNPVDPDPYPQYLMDTEAQATYARLVDGVLKVGTTAVGGPPASTVEGVVVHDGTAGGGVRPTGFARVRWVGGATRPTNMVTGDVWEHDA